MRAYGKKSRSVLATLHPDLQRVLTGYLPLSRCDISLVYGYRGKELQNELHRTGKSQLKYPQSKHNTTDANGEPCSEAVDAYPYIGGLIVGKNQKEIYTICAMMGGLIEYARSQGVVLRWGADWDSDGDITDTNFLDAFHVELVL
jgi:peptidoglycan L-alanyl-D-glutamate endopeptidase CwlK